MDTLTLIDQKFSSVDRTQKLIYTLERTDGPVTIEVGSIDKQDGKKILCVPTQTNCAQACKFCHTTELAGKVAVSNLNCDEIAAIVRMAFCDSGMAETQNVLLISFMGMGEPMANATQLILALVRLHVWAKSINLRIRFAFSTMLPAKHLPDFLAFTNAVRGLRMPVKMHLSLHYTTDPQRRKFMPTASSIVTSLYHMEVYRKATGNPVEIHYTLIAGENDSMGDVFRLRALLKDSKTPVKFLLYNPVAGDPCRSPEDTWVDFIREELGKDGIPTEWYDSPGADIAAACGMFLAEAYIPTPRAAVGPDELVQIGAATEAGL